jgi:cysteinyl-tRNA synthetase
LGQFVSKHKELDGTVISTAKAAFEAYLKKNLPLLPHDTSPDAYQTESTKAYKRVVEGKALEEGGVAGDKEAKLKMHLKTASSAAEALQSTSASISLADFLAKSEDSLLPYLDSLSGSSIDANDHSIFTKLTKRFEQRFFEDMDALNVLYPDVVTRVTEFGPEIVNFVVKVVDNGFAYVTSDGSVYFDIANFENAGNHYARLEPWNRNDKELQNDGEGALTGKTSEKRSESDFAVWKASRPGEPSWPSPFGPGRPGCKSNFSYDSLASILDCSPLVNSTYTQSTT